MKHVETEVNTLASSSGKFIEHNLETLPKPIFNNFRDDPLLCISDALICDGIRNCPVGGGAFSDEDENLCRKHRFDDQDLQNVSLFLLASSDFKFTYHSSRTFKSLQFGNIWRSESFKICSDLSSQPQQCLL